MNGDQWAQLVPLLLIVLAFWFLVLRPARTRSRQTMELQRSLAVGSTVMLTSGVFGEVVRLTDEAISLRIAPGVTITAHRNAVGKLMSQEDVARLRADGLLDGADGSTARPAE